MASLKLPEDLGVGGEAKKAAPVKRPGSLIKGNRKLCLKSLRPLTINEENFVEIYSLNTDQQVSVDSRYRYGDYLICGFLSESDREAPRIICKGMVAWRPE